MGIPRRRSLQKIMGKLAAVRLHVDKLRNTGDPNLARYWRKELRSMLDDIRHHARMVGTRTELEVMTRVIEFEKEIQDIPEIDA